MEREQTEHQRIHQIEETRLQPRRLSDLPRFVPKESWGYAGFISPEATVQTYFWALREGKFDQVQDSMVPSIPQDAVEP